MNQYLEFFIDSKSTILQPLLLDLDTFEYDLVTWLWDEAWLGESRNHTYRQHQ